MRERDFESKHVSSKDLQNLYDNQMVAKEGPARWIYDEIWMLTPLCPLCKHQVVGNIDHFLPKSKFPLLSVATSNLVPVCRDCNFAKLDDVGKSPDTVALHPYFDDLGSEKWLFAEVVERRPGSATYHVIPPSAWSSSLGARVSHQFDQLRLARLYSSQASRELNDIRAAVARAHSRDGARGVRQQLEDQAFSRGLVDKNSWAAALYVALVASSWYCDGGFVLA
ncbi:HNH endonuclease [Modestobacter sp. URMC 112]